MTVDFYCLVYSMIVAYMMNTMGIRTSHNKGWTFFLSKGECENSIHYCRYINPFSHYYYWLEQFTFISPSLMICHFLLKKTFLGWILNGRFRAKNWTIFSSNSFPMAEKLSCFFFLLRMPSFNHNSYKCLSQPNWPRVLGFHSCKEEIFSLRVD